MAAFFISDVHLKPYIDSRTLPLCTFLEKTLLPNDRLIFVGDIFEFWMGGQKIWVERYSEFVLTLQKLLKRKVRISFFEGNHDIHVDKYFEPIGVQVFTKPQILNLYGRSVLVEHGDDFNDDDISYFLLRWFLRSPVLRWVANKVPGKCVTFFSDWGTKQSHKRTAVEGRVPEVIEDIKRKTKLYVERRLHEEDFDLLIMGHTHVREDYEVSLGNRKARFINLGSWYEQTPKILVLQENGDLEYLAIELGTSHKT